MKVDQMRAELMKLYPNRVSWKYKISTWPDDRIRAVFNSCVKYDRWNRQKKEQELAKKENKAGSSYYQMTIFDYIGGNNELN